MTQVGSWLLRMVLISCILGIVSKATVLPSIRDIKDMIGSEKDVDLWTVGMYIAAFKYFGGILGKKLKLFQEFPHTVHKDIDKELAEVCETNAEKCVKEVLKIAKKSDSLQYLLTTEGDYEETTPKELEEFAPFTTYNQKYNFQMTAMYYLCWYAAMGDTYLEFSKSDISCLEQLYLVKEAPAKKRKAIQKKSTKRHKPFPRIITDVRDLANMHKREPLLCARIWFCPQVCYGTLGRFLDKNMDGRGKGNPCKDVPSATCSWQKDGNNNFEALIRNKFNVSCKCETMKSDLKWSNKHNECLDSNGCGMGSKWSPSKNKCVGEDHVEQVESMDNVGPMKEGKVKIENSEVLDDKEVDDAAGAVALYNQGGDLDYGEESFYFLSRGSITQDNSFVCLYFVLCNVILTIGDLFCTKVG